jgi:hypothetical protein
LRSHSLAKLRKYAKDYNINVAGVVEKDDLIDRIISARVGSLDISYGAGTHVIQQAPNGCLPPANEVGSRA